MWVGGLKEDGIWVFRVRDDGDVVGEEGGEVRRVEGGGGGDMVLDGKEEYGYWVNELKR